MFLISQFCSKEKLLSCNQYMHFLQMYVIPKILKLRYNKVRFGKSFKNDKMVISLKLFSLNIVCQIFRQVYGILRKVKEGRLLPRPIDKVFINLLQSFLIAARQLYFLPQPSWERCSLHYFHIQETHTFGEENENNWSVWTIMDYIITRQKLQVNKM